MRALIVDDEPIARQVLREGLEAFADVCVVGEAEHGEQALQQISGLHPDMVFLDLQMPGIGGFEVVRRLEGGALPIIIIVTAFDQHAIQAFEAGAIDYLLKPVREQRLRKALDRARLLHGKSRQVAERAAQLAEIALAEMATAAGSAASRRIVGRSGEEYFLLDAGEVMAFQAEGELVWIVTAKQRYLATQTLRAIEARLRGSSFERVHRSTIVNVNHVRKMSALSSQRWLLTLANRQEFIVSKRQAHRVREMLHW